jgi:hypothetical protein
MLSKLCSLVLGERLDLTPDRLALQNPERSGEPAAQIANDLRSFLQSLELKKGAENASRHCRKPKVNSRLYNLLRCNWQGFVDQHYSCGSKHGCARRQSGDRVSQPSNDAIVGKHNRGIDGLMKTRRADLQFKPQSVAPPFVKGCALSGGKMVGADYLKALDDGKVMTRLRRRRRGVFLPFAGPCFDHHGVLNRQPTAPACRPKLSLGRRPDANTANTPDMVGTRGTTPIVRSIIWSV